MQTAKAAEILK